MNIGDPVIFRGIHGNFECRIVDIRPNYWTDETAYEVRGSGIVSITTAKYLEAIKPNTEE